MLETAVERERTHRFEMCEAVRGRGGPLDVSPNSFANWVSMAVPKVCVG